MTLERSVNNLICMKLNNENSFPFYMYHFEDKLVNVSVCFNRCSMLPQQSHSHGQKDG